MTAPKISEKSLAIAIESGMGIGFDESYRPLLQLKRWNPSPVSVQVVKSVPPFRRQCHFFSHSEWYLALLFAWLGAYVREQFPLWPWPHPHPEYLRLPQDKTELPRSPGMLEICRQAGIDHGHFVGTTIPYIWTMDLCLYLPWIKDISCATCFVSVKPLDAERYLHIDPLHRGSEKLEGERRYAAQLKIPYFIGDRSLYQGPIFPQLEWLAEAAVLPTEHPCSKSLQRFLDAHGNNIQSYPLNEIRERLVSEFRVTANQSLFLQNHMIWHQVIDCDISLHIRDHLPASQGGRALKEALRRSIEVGN